MPLQSPSEQSYLMRPCSHRPVPHRLQRYLFTRCSQKPEPHSSRSQRQYCFGVPVSGQVKETFFAAFAAAACCSLSAHERQSSTPRTQSMRDIIFECHRLSWPHSERSAAWYGFT